MRRASCAIVFFGLFQIDCFADERPDKIGYHVFRPVPASASRRLDRDL